MLLSGAQTPLTWPNEYILLYFTVLTLPSHHFIHRSLSELDVSFPSLETNKLLFLPFYQFKLTLFLVFFPNSSTTCLSFYSTQALELFIFD